MVTVHGAAIFVIGPENRVEISNSDAVTLIALSSAVPLLLLRAYPHNSVISGFISSAGVSGHFELLFCAKNICR